jgi:hypothetical protein
MSYNSKLDADVQISAEESIASLIQSAIENSEDGNGEHDFTLTEEDCADLGRGILLAILTRFRPDLIEGH